MPLGTGSLRLLGRPGPACPAQCASMRADVPFVSVPSLLACDPVMGEGSQAVAVQRLKRQRTAYESADHMFSLPWLLPSAIWVSKPAGAMPMRVDAS